MTRWFDGIVRTYKTLTQISTYNVLLYHESSPMCMQFVAIQVVGLNMGLMIGISASIAKFVFSYASERRSVKHST